MATTRAQVLVVVVGLAKALQGADADRLAGPVTWVAVSCFAFLFGDWQREGPRPEPGTPYTFPHHFPANSSLPDEEVVVTDLQVERVLSLLLDGLLSVDLCGGYMFSGLTIQGLLWGSKYLSDLYQGVRWAALVTALVLAFVCGALGEKVSQQGWAGAARWCWLTVDKAMLAALVLAVGPSFFLTREVVRRLQRKEWRTAILLTVILSVQADGGFLSVLEDPQRVLMRGLKKLLEQSTPLRHPNCTWFFCTLDLFC